MIPIKAKTPWPWLQWVMQMVQPQDIDIIGREDARTVPGLFFLRASRGPDRVAFSEFRDGRWTDVTWAQMAQRIGRFRAALDAAGMAPGDRAAILLPNCVDWVAFDIAAMANGVITVPLYLHDSPGNIGFILANAGVRLCLVDSHERWQALIPHVGECETLARIWVRTDTDAAEGDDRWAVSALPRVLTEQEVDPTDLRCAAEDIATIIHTSGTTGLPKGVMLSHSALLWNAEAVTKVIPPLKSDVFLSLLPLAHAFERTLGYHLPMMGGSRIVYARSIEQLRDDILEIRPTILIAVPRLYERLLAAIREKAASSSVKRWLLRLAGDLGWRRHEAARGCAPKLGPVARFILWPLLERLVARPVLQAFGGRMRVAASGGAPLSTDVGQFLIGLGLPLIEGYGLTEAAPVVTATTFEDYLLGSVGRPLEGIETRIADESELLIRSPSQMTGYWNDAEQTAAAVNGDGWLRTGDIAEFREGHLFIIGRLKELTVLSTGKKVTPTAVEAKIGTDPLFEQVCVVGNNRPCLVAVSVLNGREWATLARENGLDPGDPNHPAAAAAILLRMAQATKDLPSYSQVRGVHAVLDSWTVENGVLTPTLKVRRPVIEDRYRAEIDGLFAGLETGRRSG